MVKKQYPVFQKLFLIQCFLVFGLKDLVAKEFGTSSSLSELGKETTTKFHIHGSFNMRLGWFFANGMPQQYGQDTWLVSGRSTIQWGRWSIPLNIRMGKLGKKVYGSSFNQIGIQPSFKAITLYLGHSNIDWSPYTLGGRTIFGVGCTIQTGRFRFGTIAGRFQNAVEEYMDTTFLKPPVIFYKRDGYGFKLGYGKMDNYADLIIFKAKDDIHSVQTNTAILTSAPQENLVIGITSRKKIGARIQVEFDMAASAYNRNLFSKAIEVDKSFWSNIFLFAFTPRYASRYNYATEGAVIYQYKNMAFDFRYKRVDADFKSMGAWFLQNDIEQCNLGVRMNTWANKLKWDASFGVQKNNLNNLKAQDAIRTIGRMKMQWKVNKKLGLYTNIQNYNTELQARRHLLYDTLALHQRTTHLSFGGRQNWMNSKSTQTLLFEVFRRKLAFQSSENIPGYQSKGCNLNYFLHFKKGVDINTGFNYDNYSVNNILNNRWRVDIGTTKLFLNDKLFVGCNLSYTVVVTKKTLQSNTIIQGINVNWNLSSHHRFRLTSQFLNVSPSKNNLQNAYSLWRGDATYTWQF